LTASGAAPYPQLLCASSVHSAGEFVWISPAIFA
jgi:hypothetical protein